MALTGDQGSGSLYTQIDILGNELLLLVADQCTRQEARLAKDLEAIANAPDFATVIGKGDDGLHDRRISRYGSGPQVIAVGKSAGQDNTILSVKAFEGSVFVPKLTDISSQHPAKNVHHVIIAIGTRKNDYTKFHPFVICRAKVWNLRPREKIVDIQM